QIRRGDVVAVESNRCARCVVPVVGVVEHSLHVLGERDRATSADPRDDAFADVAHGTERIRTPSERPREEQTASAGRPTYLTNDCRRVESSGPFDWRGR